jgi:glycosyltransferase involved in cell wall biosynthesis
MEKVKDRLSKSNVLLCGLAFTSRTETLENYLKEKVNSLVVISLSSCFLKENLSSCKVYESAVLKSEFKISNFRIKDYKWYRQPFIILVFMVNWLSTIHCLIKLKKRYDIYIGISYTFALLGCILKKIKVVKSLLYYCTDYYIPNSRFDFNAFFVRLINILDYFTVKNSDYIWDVSPQISEYREEIGGIKKESYRNILVPLGYSRSLSRFKPLEEINRWDIGFVGTITASQGLQLLVETMTEILKELPQIKVKVIGEGQFLEELKKSVSEKGLHNYFTFYGFIKEDAKLLDILCSCAIGIALWNYSLDDKNIICADPGKTKLYALCGLPIITTRYCSLSAEIISHKAGIIIDYNKDDFKKAIAYLMHSDEKLKEFKINSFRLGQTYISDNIFDNALEKQLL